MVISSNRVLYCFLIVLLLFLSVTPLTQAQADVTIQKNEPFPNFPGAIDFHLQVTANEPIIHAELDYGMDALSCGNVTHVAVADIEANAEQDITWRWDLLESSSFVPRGSTIWWRWRLTTASGAIWTSPEERFTFTDTWFVWQSRSQDNVTVHWYRGAEELAEDMLAAALESITQLATETGLRLTDPVQLFLYEEQFDLRLSLPGAPSWVGGVAFPEHNIVMAIANQPYRNYARLTVKHEIGHLVIGRLTFNCLSSLPTWLNEGLAMVAEGAVDERAAAQLQEAIANDSLLSIQQLEGSFSIRTERATLSYAQSESLVRFLIENYGQAKMLELLTIFKAGMTPNDALQATYGFDSEGLELAWREAIGAEATSGALPSGMATAIPTLALAGLAAATPLPAAITPSPVIETPVIPETPTKVAPPAAAIPAATPEPAPIPAIPNDSNPPSSRLPILLGGGFILFLLLMLIKWKFHPSRP